MNQLPCLLNRLEDPVFLLEVLNRFNTWRQERKTLPEIQQATLPPKVTVKNVHEHLSDLTYVFAAHAAAETIAKLRNRSNTDNDTAYEQAIVQMVSKPNSLELEFLQIQLQNAALMQRFINLTADHAPENRHELLSLLTPPTASTDDEMKEELQMMVIGARIILEMIRAQVPVPQDGNS